MNRKQWWQVVFKKCGKAMAAVAFLSIVTGLEAGTAQAEPQIVKPRMVVGVWETWHAWNPATKKFQDNATSWMPSLKFTVAGPVESGSQFSVDFTKPNGALWFHYDLATEETPAGEWATLNTPRDDSPAAEKKYSTGIGVFGFKIRLKNELSGVNKIFYTGKFKVTKVSNYNGTPVTKNKYDYVVDHDWTLPIGYIYQQPGGVYPPLAATMWFKGDLSSDIAGYIYYNGKQIGSTKNQGSTGVTEQQWNTTTTDKGDPTWQSRVMEWYNVAIQPTDADNENEKIFYLSKNPGQYEIKVLRGGKLCRQAKFAVGADGKIVDNGIASANKLNNERIFLPVKIIGAGDGAYNKLAWKTGAYYGNPLKGFTAP